MYSSGSDLGWRVVTPISTLADIWQLLGVQWGVLQATRHPRMHRSASYSKPLAYSVSRAEENLRIKATDVFSRREGYVGEAFALVTGKC